MNNIIVTVGAVTYAMKVRRLLSSQGIRSKLVKVDKSSTKYGCTHGLEMKREDFYRAVMIMRSNDIEYSVYKG